MQPNIPVKTLFAAFTLTLSLAGAQKGVFLSQDEAQELKKALSNCPVLLKSYQSAVDQLAAALSQPIVIPPPGEAGSYEHEKHKQNGRYIQLAGTLYLITGKTEYASYARDLLNAYAQLYPQLGRHPLAHNQAPGKLFHQMLNETVWLLNASLGYDCIKTWLRPEERTIIEKQLFRPMLSWFTQNNAKEMNRIHNHGTWTVAAVGTAGLILEDQELVQQALYGTNKDGRAGFLKQLDLLFSPDGYYMEGPYYIRYALQPFLLFAEVLARRQPELNIYAYRDSILKKAYYAAMQTTLPNGIFVPINDASRTMDITDAGIVLATDIAYYRFGKDPTLLGIANQQHEVILHPAGLAVARDLNSSTATELPSWGSVEFSDGADGQQGGLGILRTGTGKEQSLLLLKYGVHGEGHGHFDKLHFIFFDQGREIIYDYGYARWINVEHKFGGRYLPENQSYAMQTIAHNTVTVDQRCQNDGQQRQADRMSGKRHFFDARNPQVQVVSALANDYYPNVAMQRTMFLIRHSSLEYPVVVDLFRIRADQEHQYDYPLHFHGQLIATNVKYSPNTNLLQPLGAAAGYQHIWQEARGQFDQTARVTWLDGQRYYTVLISGIPNSELILGRTGANDPNFNLRVEPLMIFRQRAKDHLFAAVIEPHGYFDESKEVSRSAQGVFQDIRVIGHNDIGTVVELSGKNNLKWRIIVFNGVAKADAPHTVVFQGRSYHWQGNYAVNFEVE